MVRWRSWATCRQRREVHHAFSAPPEEQNASPQMSAGPDSRNPDRPQTVTIPQQFQAGEPQRIVPQSA